MNIKTILVFVTVILLSGCTADTTDTNNQVQQMTALTLNY